MIYGSKSQANLATIEPVLRSVLVEAAKDFDFCVICGLRGKEEQEAAVANKTSKAHYPFSDHNKFNGDFTVSGAADCMPYPIEWPDKKKDTELEYARKLSRICLMAAHILGVAKRMGINDIGWGGKFEWTFDGPHIYRKSA